MDALSSLTRHPIERPTHPVDHSRAPKKTRRIRSSTRGASYDRIVRKKKDPSTQARSIRSSHSNASYDRIGRPVLAEPETARKEVDAPQVKPPQSLFSGYLIRTRIQIGMTFSFSR